MPLRPRVHRLVTILLAHAGWHPELRSVDWLGAVAASIAVASWVTWRGDPTITFTYFGLAWAFYYLGNTLVLHRRQRAEPHDRSAEPRAWRRYQMVLGLMFLNIGLALGAMCALEGAPWMIPLPEVMLSTVGALLFAVGLVVKVWATDLVGIDTYYYKDAFTGRPLGLLVRSGPYRLFANPMNGIGNLHAYGLALMAGSATGLVAAALCHVGIHLFYVIAELPFVRRVYLAQAPATLLGVAPTTVREAP